MNQHGWTIRVQNGGDFQSAMPAYLRVESFFSPFFFPDLETEQTEFRNLNPFIIHSSSLQDL